MKEAINKKLESDVIDILQKRACWKSGVSHSWWSNKRRRERDSSIKRVEGNFNTKQEALKAAENAIENHLVGRIDYATARPSVYYHVGHITQIMIGELMDEMFTFPVSKEE